MLVLLKTLSMEQVWNKSGPFVLVKQNKIIIELSDYKLSLCLFC